ncbi:EcsC family protein [Desulfosudis oleivorans]|nr:EcsC family protein [Desulfosudis oleivorans]
MANENEKKSNALDKLIGWAIEAGQQDIDQYVEKLRSQNPGISREALAKKIVRRKSVKSGLVGAGTGLGGILSLPVAIPFDLAASWKIQICMALAVARVYGHNTKTVDVKTDIYLILAGDAVKEVFKKIGVEAAKDVTKKAVEKYITKDVMKKIWKVVSRKIITKAGEKSTTSFTKMVPLVGAPVGYAFDWFATKAVGKTAIHYYSGEG